MDQCDRARLYGPAILFSVLILIGAGRVVPGQTIAVLTPDEKSVSKLFGGQLSDALAERFKVLDNALARAAYSSVSAPAPFNLTTEESRAIGTVIGCQAFVIARAETVRRSAFQRPEYYESHAHIYVVSTRTGRLLLFKLASYEAPAAATSLAMLERSVPQIATDIEAAVRFGLRSELEEISPADGFEDVPEDGSRQAANFRPPVPYRRLKPEYTQTAALYDIRATVDAYIYLDSKGNVVRTDIDRWAGFGLDESVEKNIRSMNWRPGERNGKPVAIRFLVRYNFKKVD